MAEEVWPVRYSVEIYVDSWLEPDAGWRVETPFPSVSVGDYFEHRTYDRWQRPLGPDQRLKVKEVEHIFWEIEGSHLGHKLMILLEVVKDERRL